MRALLEMWVLFEGGPYMRKYGNYLAAKSKIIVEFQNGSDPIVRASRWKTQSRPISVCQSLGQLRKPKAKSIYHLVFFHRTLVRR